MRKLVLAVVLALFLVSCQSGTTLETETEPTDLNSPRSLVLEDDSGNSIGYATPLRGNILVAPDHLWQVSQSLYYGEQAIKVLARDFRHDLIFFTVPGLKFETVPTWSQNPPGVGQTLAWDDMKAVQAAPVLSAKADFELGNVAIEEAMQLSVTTKAGSSGRPLYDQETNQIYGMLISTDAFNDVSYFVRSDIILSLANEYLGLTD